MVGAGGCSTVATRAFVSNEVRNLHLLRDGSLLVALASGVILLHTRGHFELVAELDFAVSQIVEEADGTLLLAGVKLIAIEPGKPARALIDNLPNGALVQLIVRGIGDLC